MKKQTILNIVLSLSLLGVGGTSAYKLNETNNDILTSESKIDSLTKTNSSQQDELDKKDKTVKKLEKEIKKSKETSSTTVETSVIQNTQIESDDNDVVSANSEKSIPITEYKVPTEEDNKKIAEQYAKEQEAIKNEPEYAVFDDNHNSPHRFLINNGLFYDEFLELNPQIKSYSDMEKGKTYRIK